MLKQFITLILIAGLAIGFYSCSEKEVSSSLSAESQLFGLNRAGSSYGHLEIFTEILDLTNEQEHQIQEIMATQHEKIRESYIDNGEEASWKNRRGIRREMHEKFINEIIPVLTSEQKTIAEDMKAQFDRGEIPTQIIDKRVEKLTAEINLTADQQLEIKTLFSEHGKKMLSNRDKDVDRKTHRENMMNLRAEIDGQMKNILTPEQLVSYEELKFQCKQNFRGRYKKYGQKFRERRIERRMEHLTTALELSGGQQEQIKEILEKVQQDIESEMESADGWGAHHEIVKEKFESVDGQIKGILNETQIEKYETLKAEREKHRGYRHKRNF